AALTRSRGVRGSDYEPEGSRGRRTVVIPRVPAVLSVSLLGSLALSSCSPAHTERTVGVPEPSPADAAAASVGDAAAQDAATAPDAEVNRRGPTPVWPAAEQELMLPYRQGAVSAELSLSANPGMLDLHFNVDTTGSFGGEIDAMQTELSRTIIPRVA